MNSTCTHRNGIENAAKYATSYDFRKLFKEDMTSLYLLSYALTANHGLAERCFVTGLDDCVQGNSVFQKWARSWSRRIIARNAIRLIAPHVGVATVSSDTIQQTDAGQLRLGREGETAIASVLSLPTFERFVFVLSVLEQYADHECSALLSRSPNDVRAGRTRALQQIADLTRGSGSDGLRLNTGTGLGADDE